ncbi:MAG: hypothetical protein KGL44_05530 [Sphingomonadales bacterium]|nr:hypothetical protein [Sphingomonadales bacterium]
MEGDRTDNALRRIDAALARLESAAKQTPAPASDPSADAELAARHEALRATVARSLARLDLLIDGEQA